MKRWIFLFLICFLVISLMAQEKKENKVSKKSKVTIDFEEITEAGKMLKSYSSNTYSNMIINFISCAIIITGAMPDDKGKVNPLFITVGSIGSIYATISQIININKIGKAGKHLENSIQYQKPEKNTGK